MVGDVTFQLLSRIGIRNIQTLSEMPAVRQRMIGKNGIDIWKKANGIDNNCGPYTERKSISTEHTLIRIPHSKIEIGTYRHGRKTSFSAAIRRMADLNCGYQEIRQF
jgi:nucleotidyltransferase/DNA polymerase involved in DNA repair